MFQFIESPLFERLVYDYLDDDGYGALQAWLAATPDIGELIPGYGKGAVENIPGHLLRALEEEFVDEEESD
jgi:hypothetical protein